MTTGYEKSAEWPQIYLRRPGRLEAATMAP